MEERAYAKINLVLDITGKRSNGYHDVSMVMQTIDLYDEISIEETTSGGIVLTTDNDELNREQESNKGNLIVRAANEFMNTIGKKSNLRIRLTKRIPIAAGLAGGSSDAAATLRGLNRLYGTPFSTKALAEIGVRIGADVPFCIYGGTYLSEGIGEILTPLPCFPKSHLIIVKPHINVSTAMAYQLFDEQQSVCHPNVMEFCNHLRLLETDSNKVLKDQTQRSSNPPSDYGSETLEQMYHLMYNVLEPVTANEHPIIYEIERQLKELGAKQAMMSGSGPTVFGIFETEKDAKNAFEYLNKKDLDIFLTTTTGEGLYAR